MPLPPALLVDPLPVIAVHPHFLAADVPSPPVRIHTLLTGWQFGDWTADVAFAFVLASIAAYLWGIRRLDIRGRRWPFRRTGSFLAGSIVLVIAVVSGFASYDDSVFTVHVVQHVLLMMVAPPLLAMGAPITLALQASGRPFQSALSRFLHSLPVRLVTVPIAVGAVYFASMWIDMQTSFYPYSLRHPLVHDASHLVLLAIGCLYWWPMVAVDELPHRPPVPMRLGLLFVGIPFEAFLGISMMSMGTPIAPEHTLTDTRTGGGIFWILSMAIMLGAAIVIVVNWMNQEERRARRVDRIASREENRGSPPLRSADPHDAWAAAWIARTGSVPGSATAPPAEHQ